MQLATVTGSVRDFGGSVMPGLHPVVFFVPNANGVVGSDLLTARPIAVPTDEFGQFSKEFAVSDDVITDTGEASHLTAILRYFSDDPNAYMPDADFPQFRFTVPPGGGDLAQMIQAPRTSGRVWIGASPPGDPTEPNGPLEYTSWIDTLNGDFYDWED